MLAVDRKNYSRQNPYSDTPQYIGYGATISAPHMHAIALESLHDHLVKGERALDVGSGSGYLTTCMALMIGEKGYFVNFQTKILNTTTFAINSFVVGIDHIPELVYMATENIKTDQPGLLESGRIILKVGDGRLGCSEFAPYDAIYVGAAASSLPTAIINQLKVKF